MITVQDKGRYCEVSLKGKITHADYELFIPTIENLLNDSDNFKVLVNVMEMNGLEMQVFVDDFKFGMKHRKDFHKIALLGNKKWQKYAAKIGALFIKGGFRYFSPINKGQAVFWLVKD